MKLKNQTTLAELNIGDIFYVVDDPLHEICVKINDFQMLSTRYNSDNENIEYFLTTQPGITVYDIEKNLSTNVIKINPKQLRVKMNLWKDESGSIVSTELVLIGSLLSLGLISGLVKTRNVLLDRLSNFNQAIENLDQDIKDVNVNITIDAKNRPMETVEYGLSHD